MKHIVIAETAADAPEATVKDYSLQPDGVTRNNGDEITVKYGFEYDEIETEDELKANYSVKDLIKLANQRSKATGNSGGRQKAISKYAPDPKSPAVVRENLLKQVMLMKPKFTRAEAEAFVDSLSAA